MNKIFYVKIIKCMDERAWYFKSINYIYPVVELTSTKYAVKSQNNNELTIYKSDCEIIDFSKDPQITEEYARKMLMYVSKDYIPNGRAMNENEIEDAIKMWKSNGIIKKTREDEIKNKIRLMEPFESLNLSGLRILSELHTELIEIYREIIKNSKNEK